MLTCRDTKVRQRPAKPKLCMDCRIKPGNDSMESRSRDALTRPSFAHHHHAEKACFPSPKQGSGAPKGACQPCPRCANERTCVRHSSAPRLRGLCGRRARLSALTLAALATGYHPDGSAPEPGFRDAAVARCFAGKPRRCAALSTLRADWSLCRSTGDPEPPGSGWQIRRAGTAPRSASTACLSGKAPYGERVIFRVTNVGTFVKDYHC
jgi:hypothetical protein